MDEKEERELEKWILGLGFARRRLGPWLALRNPRELSGVAVELGFGEKWR